MTEILQTAINATSSGGFYALVAIGVALIFSIMRMVNFAHGELIMAGGYLLLVLAGVPLLLAVLIMILAVVLLAVIIERVAIRPVRGANPATLMITSYAISYLMQNLVLLTVGGEPRSVAVSRHLLKPIEIGSLNVRLIDLITIATAILMIGGLSVLSRRSLGGQQMRAAAQDFTMARLCGVRADRIVAVTFGVSGFLAAIAAVLLVAQTGVLNTTMGQTPVLLAFVATVLGGMGSLSGAAVGGFLLGAATILLQTYLPREVADYRDAILFSLVIAVLLVRPNGLIAGRAPVTRV